MYCNYCDYSHREQFSLTDYSCNSTFDSANLATCTNTLYTQDSVNRNYETYMDYWCGLLYDTSKSMIYAAVAALQCQESEDPDYCPAI